MGEAWKGGQRMMLPLRWIGWLGAKGRVASEEEEAHREFTTACGRLDGWVSSSEGSCSLSGCVWRGGVGGRCVAVQGTLMRWSPRVQGGGGGCESTRADASCVWVCGPSSTRPWSPSVTATPTLSQLVWTCRAGPPTTHTRPRGGGAERQAPSRVPRHIVRRSLYLHARLRSSVTLPLPHAMRPQGIIPPRTS